jgi:hypothetical protein
MEIDELNDDIIYSMGQNLYLKSYIDQYMPLEKNHIFYRGLFDKFGNIILKTLLHSDLKCIITFKFNVNKVIFNRLITFENIECSNSHNFISYSNWNAINFLSKLYDNSDARYRNNDLYNIYLKLINPSNIIIPTCQFHKKNENAIIPIKNKASDIGYDLSIISKIKNLSLKTALYDTGIICTPEFGYNITILPSSILSKKGYLFSGSIIIENETLKIYLIRIDDKLPKFSLPFNCCKLVLNKHIHYLMEEKI